MRKDNGNLKPLKKIVVQIIDPFDKNLPKENLFNIKTGRETTTDIETYLLSMVTKDCNFCHRKLDKS